MPDVSTPFRAEHFLTHGLTPIQRVAGDNFKSYPADLRPLPIQNTRRM